MNAVIIGAGTGLYQILDAVSYVHSSPSVFFSAVFDNDPALRSKEIDDSGHLRVQGGKDELLGWHAYRPSDLAIISIGDPGPRKEWREYCNSIGMSLISVVDPSTRQSRWSDIGPGCLISAHCHLGAHARIGHNCKLSPYCSIEHHSEVGDDCTFGPGVITSGNVKIGSRCKFGTGIFIEPRLTIGDDCVIASGAVITMSVPAGHLVRTKINNSVVEIPRSC